MCTYTCMYTCVYVNIGVYVCRHVYVYTCVYLTMCTYIYACKFTLFAPCPKIEIKTKPLVGLPTLTPIYGVQYFMFHQYLTSIFWFYRS